LLRGKIYSYLRIRREINKIGGEIIMLRDPFIAFVGEFYLYHINTFAKNQAAFA
jgi:hypothetical protein